MKEIDILKTEMEICDRHVDRFLLACHKLAHAIPFTKEYLEKIADNDIANLELLTSRFGKLQDTLGRKIVPLILRLINEDQSSFTHLDRLNKLEKMGLIEDVNFWIKIRELRNSIAHDYPNDIHLVENMNACVSYGKLLISQWERLKKYIEEHILPFYL